MIDKTPSAVSYQLSAPDNEQADFRCGLNGESPRRDG
jgi:hypothetical protein